MIGTRFARSASALLLACLSLPVVAVSPAAASCAAAPDPASADVPFVGEALEVDAPYALLRVVGQGSSGPSLAPEVWVRAGAEPQGRPWSLLGSAGVSSVDLRVRAGRTYVIGAFRRGSELSTSICSSVTLREGETPPEELLERTPVEGGLGGEGPPVEPWLYTAPALLLLGTLGVAVVRAARRRPS